MPRPDASAKPAATPQPQGPPKLLIGAVIAAVAAIAVVVVWIVNAGPERERSGPEQIAGAAAPPSALPEGGGIAVHHDRAAADVPTVDVYEDFQCPGCGVFEEVSGSTLTQLAEDGEIELTYHILSFLDSTMGNDSSTRAANAALCADTVGRFVEYHDTVFANQPEGEGDGWSDEQLSAFAEQAGISGADLEEFRTCTTQGRFNDYVQNMQTESEQAGIPSTPTVLVDGAALSEEQVRATQQDPTALSRIIEDAS